MCKFCVLHKEEIINKINFLCWPWIHQVCYPSFKNISKDFAYYEILWFLYIDFHCSNIPLLTHRFQIPPFIKVPPPGAAEGAPGRLHQGRGPRPPHRARGLGVRPQRAAGAGGRGSQGGDGAEDAGDGGAVEEGEGGGDPGLPAGEEEV